MRALDREHIRPVLESEIERLIDLLDTLDEDPDLESTGDEEPWLGAPESRYRYGGGTEWSDFHAHPNDDREDDGDDREEVSEDEGAQCDDEGEIHGDQEPESENPSVYSGPCSPIATMIGGSNA